MANRSVRLGGADLAEAGQHDGDVVGGPGLEGRIDEVLAGPLRIGGATDPIFNLPIIQDGIETIGTEQECVAMTDKFSVDFNVDAFARSSQDIRYHMPIFLRRLGRERVRNDRLVLQGVVSGQPYDRAAPPERSSRVRKSDVVSARIR